MSSETESAVDHRLVWFEGQIPGIFAAATQQEFKITEEGLDRHGTFEWTATRFHNDLNRYVALGVTLLDEAGPSSPCNADVLVGADDGSARFMRQLIRHRLFARIDDMQQAIDWFTESIRLTVDAAMRIQSRDLLESKPFPSP